MFEQFEKHEKETVLTKRQKKRHRGQRNHRTRREAVAEKSRYRSVCVPREVIATTSSSIGTAEKDLVAQMSSSAVGVCCTDTCCAGIDAYGRDAADEDACIEDDARFRTAAVVTRSAESEDREA